MNKKKFNGIVTDDDLNAFYQAMKGIKLMHQEKILITSPKENKVRNTYSVKIKEYSCEEPALPLLNFSAGDSLPLIQGEELISYKQDSISNKILRKLSKGQYNIDAILDLHGLTVEKANNALYQFLNHCFNENKRILLVIHGKGRDGRMPLLKNKVNHWLRETKIVLAFCSAKPLHGGRGAIYVLLKKL